jgi:hypothetical protein
MLRFSNLIHSLIGKLHHVKDIVDNLLLRGMTCFAALT